MLYRLRVTRLLLRRINLNTTRQLSEDTNTNNLWIRGNGVGPEEWKNFNLCKVRSK